MAQTTYTTPVITLGTRRAFYDKLSLLILHLDYMNLNLQSVVLNGNSTVSITLNNPVPMIQLEHLGLAGLVTT